MMWMLVFISTILIGKKAVKLLNKKICKTFSKLSECKGLSVHALQKLLHMGFGVLIFGKRYCYAKIN